MGSRLGPYEVLAPLGAGGMGEVYRARDTRLSREVAVKVLPAAVASDPERLNRFETEARAASALNHPAIVTIYDVGQTDGVSWIAMELVEGTTLRELMLPGPLPIKKLLQIAPQITDGLAKAHESGIVHRDLKPENVMVTKDGLVKILDFGLAKLKSMVSGNSEGSQLSTMEGTTPGVVVGTVSYMSPEQASGHPVDFRSDQFSLGSVLYEMASGRKAFLRKTVAETLTAIIREEPAPLEKTAPSAPAPVRWIVERCLAKEPGDRYDSTRDLARDLASVRDHASEVSSGHEATLAGPVRSRRRLLPLLAGAVIVSLITLGLAFLLGRRTAQPEPPLFQRLTWRRGRTLSARFAPDGQTVLYGASWDGEPPAIYIKRPESPDAVRLDLPGANLLAVSPTGEMAILLNPRTLARVPLTGGTPREIVENVSQVDWGPDGRLLVARDVNGKGRLEYPLGKVLYETTGHVSYPRFSPREGLIAFVDHPLEEGDDRGSIAVVDLHGKKRTLSKEFASVQGLAWSPSGEVWFAAAAAGTSRSLWGVALSGRQRPIARVPGDLRLEDVTRSGRVLLTRGEARIAIRWSPPGEARERELSWFGNSLVAGLSPDGKTIVFQEQGEPAGPNYAVCLWRMDGSPVRLGEGIAGNLSPDGKWVISGLPESRAPLVLLPTGPGEPKEIDTRGIARSCFTLFPDGKRLLLVGRESGRGLSRLFVQSLDGGKPRPISPEGVGCEGLAISRDGKLVAAAGPGPKIALHPVDGGDPRPVAGTTDGDQPLQWSADGGSLYVRQASKPGSPARVFRVDLKTGERVLWKELFPEDPAGVAAILPPLLTPDGRFYAYSYARLLSDLYLVEGLK